MEPCFEPRKVVHVPKVIQQERQHHFHVEEVVDVPMEQHVEQVVQVPVVSASFFGRL